MMTEEDRAAWSGVTDQAARYLFDTVSNAASVAILKGALSKLIAYADEPEEKHRALIYQMLMAATEAGFACGVRVYEHTGRHSMCTAYVELPGGAVGFDFSADTGITYLARQKMATEVIDEFLKR